MPVPPEVQRYVRELNAGVSRVLGRTLSGVYLHGSAAMGGWNERQSDVDVLVVVSNRLAELSKAALTDALRTPTAPGAGLECSVVADPSGTGLSARPPFELHIVTGGGAKVVDGAGHPGDSDLVMHYAVCRERGIAISGPPPEAIFPEIPRPVLLRALRDELAWGMEHAPLHYAVLNACRAWAYAEDSRILSKLEGADWAFSRGIDPDVVRAAVAAQRGEPAMLEAAAVATLAGAATDALSGAIDPSA